MLDLVTIGRCSMDLFSEQPGKRFVEIESFSTSVGGSPTNVAIGAGRLGLRTAALTAVGDDMTGAFVRSYLEREGVGTEFVLTKPGRTALAVVGVEPPDYFPLVFYRDSAPDVHISVEDVGRLAESRFVLVAGTNFSRGALVKASLAAVRTDAVTVLDLDYRHDQWAGEGEYAAMMGVVLPVVDVAIGTEEEWGNALGFGNLAHAKAQRREGEDDDRTKARRYEGGEDLEKEIKKLGIGVAVLKVGGDGVRLCENGGDWVSVAGFPADVVNTVGAGDAFASGFVYGLAQGWSSVECARFGNGCGAIVVGRHGCSAAFPTLDEILGLMGS